MRIAILGAGLVGSGVALELAGRNIKTSLFDRAKRCVDGASRNNEGKVHLGFVYGKDPSRSTARLMAKSALQFQPILRRWIGSEIDRVAVSSPFIYPVGRDSQLSVDECLAFFGEVHALCRDYIAAHGLDYFNQDFDAAPTRIARPEAAGLSDHAAAYLSTYEVAIDPEALADAVDRRVRAEPSIDLNLECEIIGIKRLARGFEIRFRGAGGVETEIFDRVVNALWDGRLAIDAQLGMRPTRPWLFRYKEFVRCSCPTASDVPSITIVLGPYGDVVNYGGGRMYLSWYPVGLRSTTGSLLPPDVSEVTRGRDAGQTKLAMRNALAKFAPGLEQMTTHETIDSTLGGGWIFGWGSSGIDDPASGLHQRFEVGPMHADGYVTVDPGKLTSAPMFAVKAADMVMRRD
jgi:glycine/D-amino acid oxidase-like deaminating enzyme